MNYKVFQRSELTCTSLLKVILIWKSTLLWTKSKFINVPTIMEDDKIEFLIGRYVITAHHVLDQRLGEGDFLIGQRLPLGQVIIGQVCMTNLHYSNLIKVNKTSVLQNRRTSLFKPCDSKFQITDNTFVQTEHDKKTGLSIEDKTFLQ